MFTPYCSSPLPPLERPSAAATGTTECRRVSRRELLTGTVLILSTAAAAMVVSPAAAAWKMSQDSAKYQGAPKGNQRCDGCVNFQQPQACKLVEGDISPSGWCQYFASKT
jgi:hypothetical protein